MSRSRAAFLEVADRIGARLCRDAIFAGNRCNWIGDSLESDEGELCIVQRAFGPDLYSGTSGIGLFLSRLSEQTGDRIQRRTARAALSHAYSCFESESLKWGAGLYSGILGTAYALIEADAIFPNGGSAGTSIGFRRRIAFLSDSCSGADVISGDAGTVQGLIAIFRRTSDGFFLELAVTAGDRLIKRAHRQKGAWSWAFTDVPTAGDLTGLSHGAAGIALALLELWEVTRESRFREAAEGGFAYERSLFSAQHGNWPDLRMKTRLLPESDANLDYMIAWCHGAAGIGLSRLRAFELTRHSIYREEAEVAAETTTRELKRAAPSDFSLCHGTFGNTELLLAASDFFGSIEARDFVERIALEAACSYSTDCHWPCGVRGGGETPGLMLGIAGIGYHFLRLLDSHSHPSVLCIT